MDPLEQAVLASNAAFYQALAAHDFPAMSALWATEAPVACVHPGMGVLVGRAAVLASWRGILGHPNAPVVRCMSAVAHVLGTSAFVTCLEGHAERPALCATNVFVLERGRWRLVHHHSGPLSAGASQSSPPPPTEPPPSTPPRWN